MFICFSYLLHSICSRMNEWTQAGSDCRDRGANDMLSRQEGNVTRPGSDLWQGSLPVDMTWRLPLVFCDCLFVVLFIHLLQCCCFFVWVNSCLFVMFRVSIYLFIHRLCRVGTFIYWISNSCTSYWAVSFHKSYGFLLVHLFKERTFGASVDIFYQACLAELWIWNYGAPKYVFEIAIYYWMWKNSDMRTRVRSQRRIQINALNHVHTHTHTNPNTHA